jgi:hypothetical protein
MQLRRARSGWASFRARQEVHLLKRQVMFVKTPIKIRKAQDRKVSNVTETSSVRINAQRTTEVIVKNWIIESPERRRLVLNRLQDAVRRKDI